MSYRMRCYDPNCLDQNCIVTQYCGETISFKNTKETLKKKDTTVSDSHSSDSSVSSSASSVSYDKSKKLKGSKSKSSVNSNSESDSDSSSSDSLFSSSSSTSSTSSTSSFSEQVVPNLVKRKNIKSSGKTPKFNQNEEEDVVFIECKDPACTDPNCNVQLIQSGHKCNNLNCSDKNCIPSANSPLSSNCNDPHCSSCDNGHGNNSNVRNTFLGIAGVILLAMIGYLTFIKIKARRSRNPTSKGYLTTEMIKN